MRLCLMLTRLVYCCAMCRSFVCAGYYRLAELPEAADAAQAWAVSASAQLRMTLSSLLSLYSISLGCCCLFCLPFVFVQDMADGGEEIHDDQHGGHHMDVDSQGNRLK